MRENLIQGDWFFGNKSTDIKNNNLLDDTENEARFYENEILDSKKTTIKNKVYKVAVFCDIKTKYTKDVFTALVKENSDKHIELMARFSDAWKNFIENGGGFKSDKKEDLRTKDEIEAGVISKKELHNIYDRETKQENEIKPEITIHSNNEGSQPKRRGRPKKVEA